MGPRVEMGTPMTMAIARMRMEDLVGMETLQIGEGEDLLERMEIQREEMEVLTLMIVGMGMILHSHQDSTLPRRRGHRKPKYVYVLQGPPWLPDQEGQPGQAGRDGRDGQALSLTRALEEALRAQRTNLDTTGLANPFSQFGRTTSEVLKAQQRTN